NSLFTEQTGRGLALRAGAVEGRVRLFLFFWGRVGRMRRRDFLTLVRGVTVAWPLGGAAQDVHKVARIGILGFPPSPALFVKPFHDGLRELGYVDGRNDAVNDACWKADIIPTQRPHRWII